MEEARRKILVAGMLSLLILCGSGYGFSGAGSGTESAPYVITTVQQLQEMQNDLAAYYILGNDIDASETQTWNGGTGFKPIEGYEASFTGNLDGKGYRINDLYIKRPYESHTGLFGEVNGAEIKNVVLENVYVLGRQGVGGLVGSVQYWNYTYPEHSRISNCSVTGNITGSSYDTGGIVGFVKDGTITGCRFSGTIQGYSCVGGIVGYLSSNSSLENSHAIMEITKGSNAGGLVGLSRSNLSNCYAMGRINISSDRAGGLVGWLIGSGAVSNSYSTVIINAYGDVGGLIGWRQGNIYSSYWDKEVSGLENMCGDGTCENLYGKTTAEMQTKTTFTNAGWDFVCETANGTEDIWFIDGVDYPRLCWGRCPEQIEIPMKLTPQTVNPGSEGKWIKAHFKLPEGVLPEEVDVNSPAVLEPLGIKSEYIEVFVNDEGLVEVLAAFYRSNFCCSEPIGDLVTVEGLSFAGQCFYGTDTVRVIDNRLELIASLAMHWLEDCAGPDGCDGSDVNEDGVVNLRDFALAEGFCLEAITE